MPVHNPRVVNSVQMSRGTRTVRYVCPECDHAWYVITPDRDEMFRRD